MNCLKNIIYDSDHDAVQLIAYGLNNNELFELIKEEHKPRYLFKHTNWQKFQKEVEKAIVSTPFVPNNRNLSNPEIDSYVKKLSDIIVDSIDKTVPKLKSHNIVPQILTPIIKKLQAEKSKIVTQIKKHNRFLAILPPNRLIFLKNNLKLIRKLIQDNFVAAVNNLYETKLRSISTKDPIKMYEEVKRQFKTNENAKIDVIKIDQSDLRLLNNVGVEPALLETEPTTNKLIFFFFL